MHRLRSCPQLRPARKTPLLRAAQSALALARETRALLIQSTVMHCDIAPTNFDKFIETQSLVVVLHGMFATAGALRPLRRYIEQSTGFATASFSYEPGCDLATLVERLRNFVRAIPARCPIYLVGHSMGGLAARYFAQVGPGDTRIQRTVSLASPFFGTRIAELVPSFFCRDLYPNSPILRRLMRNHHRASRIEHASIASTHDQIVLPRHSAIYPHGRRVIVTARGHNTLLFDRGIAHHVVQSLLSKRLTTDSPMQGEATNTLSRLQMSS